MGGFGSGNWYRSAAKPIVEDCLALDVRKLARDGMLAPNYSGSLTWHDTGTGERRGAVGYCVLPEGEGLRLILQYRFNDAPAVELPIRLQTTRPHFGGRRWWFTCPLTVNGSACRRRVAKLYMRQGYFGCRHCHGLTYQSSQDAHQLERLLGQV